MNQPNKFAPPKASVEAPSVAKAKALASNALAGLILLQSLAMLLYATLLFELVRTGAVSVVSGLGIVLAWCLLLAGGIRLLVGTRRPRYMFAISAVLGLVSLSKMPMLFAVTGVVLAAIAFAASFLQSKQSTLNEPTEV